MMGRNKLRVLVACEFSGVVREAFRRRGHDAWSCDLLPAEDSIHAAHYIGDVRDMLHKDWDLMIAHPDCTYLTNSGVQWLWNTPKKPKPNVLYGAARWKALDEGAKFFQELLSADIPRIAVENPIPHKYAVERIGRTYDQLIQPYQFSHPESKATCLWLKGLPPLMSTEIVPLPRDKAQAQRGHYLSPSPTRWMDRARTYQGIADAMAVQWGGEALNMQKIA